MVIYEDCKKHFCLIFSIALIVKGLKVLSLIRPEPSLPSGHYPGSLLCKTHYGHEKSGFCFVEVKDFLNFLCF